MPACARALAERILGALSPDPGKAGAGILAGLDEITDYDGWCRIDSAETANPPPGRCRAKITTREGMLGLARQEDTQ